MSYRNDNVSAPVWFKFYAGITLFLIAWAIVGHNILLIGLLALFTYLSTCDEFDANTLDENITHYAKWGK